MSLFYFIYLIESTMTLFHRINYYRRRNKARVIIHSNSIYNKRSNRSRKCMSHSTCIKNECHQQAEQRARLKSWILNMSNNIQGIQFYQAYLRLSLTAICKPPSKATFSPTLQKIHFPLFFIQAVALRPSGYWR